MPPDCYWDGGLKKEQWLRLLDQQKIKTADASALKITIEKLSKIRWNAHANAPFGGPAQILEYSGRYTHKTAITAHRIKEITSTSITFTYKDYTDQKEFARRFEQLILPKWFAKNDQHMFRHLRYNA